MRHLLSQDDMRRFANCHTDNTSVKIFRPFFSMPPDQIVWTWFFCALKQFCAINSCSPVPSNCSILPDLVPFHPVNGSLVNFTQFIRLKILKQIFPEVGAYAACPRQRAFFNGKRMVANPKILFEIDSSWISLFQRITIYSDIHVVLLCF